MTRVKIAARGSPLSRRQVEEVMGQLGAQYECEWMETTGDRDLKSSLGPMEKTDFFTREIDKKVLLGECAVGIHSAKDLPDPLPKGLEMIALTRGIDGRDSLVMREGDRLETLRKGAVVGSSSERRNQVVRGLRPDLMCREIRGGVDQRLEALDRGEVDALVVAEAALIRLGLTSRNRIILPGKTAPLQGQLAVIGRVGDRESAALFKPIDSRTHGKTLYLGTEPKEGMVHLPLIEVVPRDFQSFEMRFAMKTFSAYSHVLFTSKQAVRIFFDLLGFYGKDMEGKKVFAIGKVTARHLEERGIEVDRVAEEETAEGMAALLAVEELKNAYILLPQSSRARPYLAQTLALRQIRHERLFLYDTRLKTPRVKPDLEDFNEIIFTSPSTVEAFFKVWDKIPKQLKVRFIGPVTERALSLYWDRG